ncbi:MAG: GNAT family N-acetyltransferase [Candidatus Saccharimonadales bacterium]
MNPEGNPEDYLVEDFASYELDEEPTIRAGFFVCANFGEPSPYARCLEGYRVATDANGTEDIEADTFYISWVNVFNERNKGVGTALITRALEEAKKRGFRVARMEVENPKVLTVFRKIGQTGLITNVRYALSPLKDGKLVDVLPTRQFNNHPHLMSSDETADYLNSFQQVNNGMVVGSASHEVECVLELS